MKNSAFKTNASSGGSNSKRRNYFQQEENSVSRLVHIAKKRVFTANHLMIQAFHLHPIIFFSILLIEYLQLVYFALFDMQILNSFQKSNYGHNDTDQSQDSTQLNHKSGTLYWNSQYNILKLLNYQLIIISQNGKSALNNYQIVLFLHLGIFLILIVGVLLLGRKRVMRAEEFQAKNDSKMQNQKQINSGDNQVSRIESEPARNNRSDKQNYLYAPTLNFILAVLIFVAQRILVIPTFYLYSTVFNCTVLENMDTYVDSEGHLQKIGDFECLSRNHIIMIAISSIIALISLGFLAVQALIFQDLNMKSTLPWRQTPSRVHYFLLLNKLIPVLFNFEILTDGPIAAAVFTFFQMIILFKRFQYTNIYWKIYRNWIIFQELSVFWFSFWNLIQKTTQFSVNIYTFSILIVGGLLPYYLVLLYVFTQWKFERMLNTDRHSLKELGSDVSVEAFFGNLLDLIKQSQKQEKDKIILYGIMRVHWYQCKLNTADKQCLCHTLVSRIDKIEKAIDEELLSRNDQFDVIKIQNQIDQLEDELIKKEEEEQKNQQKNQQQSKLTLNIDMLMNELRNGDQIKSGSHLSPGRPGPQQIGNPQIDISSFDSESKLKNTLIGGNLNVSSQNLDNSVQDTQPKQLEILEPETIRHKQKNNEIISAPKSNNDQSIIDKLKRQLAVNVLKKQIKLLFYKYVYNQIEEAILAFPFSLRLKYLAAYIQYYLLQNEIKGLFEILKIEKRNKIPFEWQFFLFKVKIEIEDYMDFVYQQRSTGGTKIDVKQVYLFAKNLQEFEIGVETISDKCQDFWKELLKKADFDANNLHKVGTEITLMNIQIFNLVNSMFAINPHHGYLLRTYALFTQKVMNNDEDSEKYFRKFLNAQKTFQSYEAATLQEELVKNFSSNIKYVIIVMRVSTQEACIVEDVNHEIRNVLGYKRNEILNKNIQMIMPKCVGNLHDQFVQNYLDTAKPKILNKQREVFALKRNGFIVQVFVYATSVPMIENEGIKFVGFLKKVDEKKHTDLLPPPIEYQFKKSIQIMAAPNGNIYGINEQAYKLLGFPKYFTEESDDKHSDYNMSQIIIDYNKVLFECFKQSPTAKRAIIDTENLKPFIVPDMHSQNDMQHLRNCFGMHEISIQAQPLDFGFKGGAYLPMIIFRIYILQKINKDEILAMTFKDNDTVDPYSNNFGSFSKLEIHKEKSKFNPHNSKEIKFVNNKGTRLEDVAVAIEEEEEDEFSEDENDSDKKQNDIINQEINKKKEKEFEKFLESSISSMSASNEGKSTDLARLREFRKMVNSRKEPQTVIFLRRFVIFITAIILTIVSINTGFKINFYNQFTNMSSEQMILNDINIQLFEIQTNFRTLINIANKFQQDEITGLVNRNQFSSQLSQNLNRQLIDLNSNKNLFLDKSNQYSDIIQNDIENIYVSSIESDGQLESQKINLNLAIGQIISKGNSLLQLYIDSSKSFKNKTFINYVNQLTSNKTNNATLFYNFTCAQYGNSIDQTTKDLYFINQNIFTTLTDKCEQIIDHIKEIKDDYINHQQMIFLALISSIFIITIFSVSLIFYIVRQIHKTRIQSLSLYAELQIDDIECIIKDLGVFMRVIKNNSDEINQIALGENNGTESDQEIVEDMVFQDDYEAQDHTPKGNYKDMKKGKKRTSKSKRKKLDGLASQSELRDIFDKSGSEDIETPSMKNSIVSNEQYESQTGLIKTFGDTNHIPQKKGNSNPIFYSAKNDTVTIQRHQTQAGKDSLNTTANAFSANKHQHVNANDSLVDTTRIMNELDMSQRELNPQEIKRTAKLNQNNNKAPGIGGGYGGGGPKSVGSSNFSQYELPHKEQPKDAENKLPEEDNSKVGNLDKFKMVKSNSGLRVITMIMLLFSFVILIVISNFALFVPMYKEFQTSHHQEQLILSQFRQYYKIYSQIIKDLVTGKIEYTIQDSYLSNYQYYQNQKFDNQQKISDLIQHHSSYLEQSVQLLQNLNTNSYCQNLYNNYEDQQISASGSLGPNALNITFCYTVDNKVAASQGFKIQIDRMIGELQKIRLAFEQKPIDYNDYLYLLDRDQILSKFQLIMMKLFTPTFYALKSSIEENFDIQIKKNQNIDISFLSVFIGAQLLILIIAWPRFLNNMNNQISKSRGILTLIPSRLIISNNNIKKIIEQNKLLTQ